MHPLRFIKWRIYQQILTWVNETCQAFMNSNVFNPILFFFTVLFYGIRLPHSIVTAMETAQRSVIDSSLQPTFKPITVYRNVVFLLEERNDKKTVGNSGEKRQKDVLFRGLLIIRWHSMIISKLVLVSQTYTAFPTVGFCGQ